MCDVIDEAQTRNAAAWLAATADPTRLRIIRKLALGESNVTDLATALGVEIVNISHHLGVMRVAGVVQSQREGRCIVYSLANVKAADAHSVTLVGPGITLRVDL
jgi:ArsR family transcriptional regulator